MNNEGLGENTADQSKQSIIRKRSSGFRLVTAIEDGPVPEQTIVVADEISPLPERPLDQILEDIGKPRFAFERTFEGKRYTRKIQ